MEQELKYTVDLKTRRLLDTAINMFVYNVVSAAESERRRKGLNVTSADRMVIANQIALDLIDNVLKQKQAIMDFVNEYMDERLGK